MKNNKNLKQLCVCAMMIALSTALSFVKVKFLPFGGSITLLSMLPVALVSIMYGLKQGFFSSFIYALIQLVFGITQDGLLGWGLTAGMLVACIVLDYIAAFTSIGIAGIFRNKGSLGIMAGTLLALAIRFICHILSGVYVFASAGKLWDGFETSNTWLYSFVYNATYMLPEMILTALGAFFVYKALDKVKLNKQ